MSQTSIHEIIEEKIEKLDKEKKQIEAKIVLLEELLDDIREDQVPTLDETLARSLRAAKHTSYVSQPPKQKPTPVPTKILSKSSRVNEQGKMVETVEEYIG